MKGAAHDLDGYVSATAVRSGRLRVFDTSELSVDAVLASACLPTLFQAVAIDGEEYWDGGYAGNPSLLPLVDHSGARGLLIGYGGETRQRSEVSSDTTWSGLQRKVEVSFDTTDWAQSNGWWRGSRRISPAVRHLGRTVTKARALRRG